MSNASDGDEHGAMVAELAPQIADMHVESAILWLNIALEHFREETLACHDCTDRLDEARHDCVLDRRKLERRALQRYLAIGWFPGYAGDPDQDGRLCAGCVAGSHGMIAGCR